MSDQINFITAVALIFVMVGVLVAIGIATGYPAAVWIGNRLGDFLSCMPRERFTTAPPALGVGAAKAARGDLAGAVAAYEAMLVEHPGEKEIHIRLLEIVLGPLHQPERGEEILQRALQHLPDEEDRRVLLNLSAALKNGTHRPYRYLILCPEERPEGMAPPPLARR